MNADLSSGSLSVLKDVLTVGAQSPSPSVVSSDSASALPTWLLIALLALVALIIVAMFSLVAYSLSAARATLKNLIGRRVGHAQPTGLVSPSLIRMLAVPDRGGRRTTRTILAIAGFSLLGLVVIGMFGLSGQGVRDLRSQVVASITTLVAAIAGFYFGAQKAGNNNPSPGDVLGEPSGGDAPGLGPDPNGPVFAVGLPGYYVPTLEGTPLPTVSVSSGALPPGLDLNPATGVITGTPASGTAGEYNIQLTARNGISPDATLDLRLLVMASGAPMLGPDPDPNSSLFIVGEAGTYVPTLEGTPPPTVRVSSGALPPGLDLNPATGVITGTPASGTAGEYNIQLTARNGISPDATLDLRLSVTLTAPTLSS